MQSRTVARELALLMLGQVSDRGAAGAVDPALDALLQQALATLSHHVREALDQAATDLQAAQQQLLDSELQDQGQAEAELVRRGVPEQLLQRLRELLNS